MDKGKIEQAITDAKSTGGAILILRRDLGALPRDEALDTAWRNNERVVAFLRDLAEPKPQRLRFGVGKVLVAPIVHPDGTVGIGLSTRLGEGKIGQAHPTIIKGDSVHEPDWDIILDFENAESLEVLEWAVQQSLIALAEPEQPTLNLLPYKCGQCTDYHCGTCPDKWKKAISEAVMLNCQPPEQPCEKCGGSGYVPPVHWAPEGTRADGISCPKGCQPPEQPKRRIVAVKGGPNMVFCENCDTEMKHKKYSFTLYCPACQEKAEPKYSACEKPECPHNYHFHCIFPSVDPELPQPKKAITVRPQNCPKAEPKPGVKHNWPLTYSQAQEMHSEIARLEAAIDSDCSTCMTADANIRNANAAKRDRLEQEAKKDTEAMRFAAIRIGELGAELTEAKAVNAVQSRFATNLEEQLAEAMKAWKKWQNKAVELGAKKGDG